MHPKIPVRNLALQGFKPIALQQKEARLNAAIQNGLEFHQRGDLDSARELYASVLREVPNHFDALHLSGVICSQTGEHELAIELLSKAIAVNKNHAVAHNNLGNVHAQLANWPAAVRSYDQAIHLDQRYALAFFNRGIAEEELGDLDAALTSYRRAIQIAPQYAQVHSNCGAVLEKIGIFDEALAHFDRAIALDPTFAGAHYNRATHLMRHKRYDEALASFNRAIEIQPQFADAYWNSSLTHLFQGDWAAGWDKYDWRWLRSDLGSDNFRPPLETNRLAHAAIDTSNLKVFIWNEQGVGDVVFHASMFSEAVAHFGSVTVQTDHRLITLLQRSIEDAVFVDKSEPVDTDQFDLHLAHGDLGFFFRRDARDFQRIKPRYLQSDTNRARLLRAELGDHIDLLCGITWRSNHAHMGQAKSMDLHDLLPLFQIEGIRFINLQYGNTSNDLFEFKSEYGIDIINCPMVDNFSDLDGHAALVDACDVIITVSNTTAHIAGGLGKPTHVMLPKVNGTLWYWANCQDKQSMWYPTVQIHEQSQHGDWDEVVSTIATTIKEKYLLI